MNLCYTDDQLKSKINYYEQKYYNSESGRIEISWKTILDNVKLYRESVAASIPMDMLSWRGFLGCMANMEESIGLFGYKKVGTFHRIFTMFGRAYLEESETISTPAAKAKNMHWLHESSKYFRSGDGEPGDIDLVDQNDVVYDVKNDYIDFKRAHKQTDLVFGGLLKYRSKDGVIEHHVESEDPSKGSFKGIFDVGRPVAQMAIDLGLDPLLFDKKSTEEMIRNYLGLD